MPLIDHQPGASRRFAHWCQQTLLRPLADPAVGAVSGELMFERLSADYGLHFVEALDPDEKRWGEALVGTD